MECEFCGRIGGRRSPLGGGAELVVCRVCQRTVEKLHAHKDQVHLPDGSRVTAASFFAGYDRSSVPEFGCYLDAHWAPPWPCRHVDWPDMGTAPDGAGLRLCLMDLLARARGGQLVELGCLGGHGRTGTALACLAALTGVLPAQAVSWVRQHYCPMAVETPAQEDFVARFEPVR